MKNSKKLRKKKKISAKRKNKTKTDYLLSPGDLIQIIAPASSTDFENVVKGAEQLAQWGYQVKFASDMLNPELFLSNSDQYRFEDFKHAVNDPEVKAIWCLRGGYGSIRLLPMIKKLKKPNSPKLIVGLSDISSLQIAVHKNWGWSSLHTSLIDRIAQNKLDEENLNEIKGVLNGTLRQISFDNLVPLNTAAKFKKTIKGKVIGGNLMVATSTLGTDFQIKSDGMILFFEELAERGYRIDRCLQQLKQAGVLKKAKAIVFGDFTQCEEPNGNSIVRDVLVNFAEDLKIPVLIGIENGHGFRQRPLFFNTPSVLNCGKTASLVVTSPYK